MKTLEPYAPPARVLHARTLMILLTWFWCVSNSHAGLFKLDFAILAGEAEGWDTFTNLVEDETYELTDRAGTGDDDVILSVINGSESPLTEFTGNNPAPPTESFFVGDIEIPVEASGDYLYRNPDTGGTSALFRFDRLDPGDYRISVFEGRMTDSQQFAKLWAGDDEGSGEPENQNTQNYAGMQNIRSLDLTLNEGQNLWFRYLEDNSGGVSGLIINQLRSLEVLVGDFNSDGAVDSADFTILADHFNQDGTFSQGDINFSGHIDLDDFIEFRREFNAQNAGAAAVPEPTSVMLVLLLVLGMAGSRRPRRAGTGRR